MRVITEIELRDTYKKTPFTSFRLPTGCKLTPAAAQFLSERRIEVETGQPAVPARKAAPGYSGNSTGKKPEHMTHVRGTEMVPKTHPIIEFRGKLDTFEALIIVAILDAESAGLRSLATDLAELLEYSRQMMRAEVRNEPLSALSIRGWTPQEIRERSHQLSKYYGISHFTPQAEHGRIMAQLNFLRTQARELELSAVRAFYQEGQMEREDILQAVNRFSSLVYLFMAQLLTGEYRL